MNRPIAIPFFAAFLLLVASTAFSQMLPGHQMSFSISATRTLTTQTDTKDSAGNCGKHFNKDKSTVSLTFSANSSKVTFKDFGNSTQSPNQALNKPATDTDQAFGGNGTITFSGACDDGIDCGGCKDCCSGDATSAWSVSENINLMTTASFEYDRGKKQGSFNLSCKYDDPQGNADGKFNPCDTQYLPSVNANLQKAALKMLGDLFGQFTIQNYSSFAGLRMAQAMKDQLQKSLDAGGNGGIATISATSSGFELSYSNSVSSSGTPTGCTGMVSSTMTTTVHVSIGGKPVEYDAILVPVGTMPSPGSGSNTVGTYEKWEPEGPPIKNGAPVGTEGNSVTFMVQLVEKGHQDQAVPDVPFKVDYKLTSSSEPGTALNYPVAGDGPTDPDLQFNPELADNGNIVTLTKDEIISKDSEGVNVAAVITSYDYGSYGTLSAKVTLANGGMTYDAHLKDSTGTTIPLPKDDNNNHIADQWEIDSGIFLLDYADDWDKVKQPNNSNDGDGFSLYEKYRGIIAKGKHVRLSPNFKNIIVGNPGGFDMSGGAALFGKASGINVVEVTLGTELDADKKIVNNNNETAHNGNQCGVKLSLESLGAGNDVDGYTMGEEVAVGSAPTGALSSHVAGANKQRVATSPVDCDRLIINKDVLNNPKANKGMNGTFAHELAHCMNVHHHGDAPTDNLRDFIHGNPPIIDGGDGTALQIVDQTGKPMQLSNFPQENINTAVVARQGSQAGGDVNCLMTYNSDYQFVRNGNLIIFCTLDPDGSTFCTSGAGTGRNFGFPGGFGPATTDGCMQQFQVKDPE